MQELAEQAERIHGCCNPWNEVSGYERLRVTRGYIQKLSERFGHPDGPLGYRTEWIMRKLRERCGFEDPYAFHEARFTWDAFAAPVPKRYLEAIGCGMRWLELSLSMDYDVFQFHACGPLQPRSYVIRRAPRRHETALFPEGCGENEALERMMRYAHEHNCPCAMHFKSLKTVVAAPHGRAWTVFYPPRLILQDGTVGFGPTGDVITPEVFQPKGS